jgi:hypothetical protein
MTGYWGRGYGFWSDDQEEKRRGLMVLINTPFQPASPSPVSRSPVILKLFRLPFVEQAQ